MKKDESIYQKADIIEKGLEFLLGRIRNLKKSLRDPHMLLREAKTQEPELEKKLVDTLDKLIEAQRLAGE